MQLPPTALTEISNVNEAVRADSAFNCSLLTIRPADPGNDDGLAGNSLIFEIQNNNNEATFLSRVKVVWPTILDYPSMFMSQFALDGYPHWQGMDIGDVNSQNNVTDTSIDASIPPGYFNNTPEFYRLIIPHETKTWSALLGNTPPQLELYVTINHFSGTELYLYNPRTPSTPCVIRLVLSPEIDLSTPILNYYSVRTPTLTWSAISWAQGYQLELDDEPTFTAPTRAEVPFITYTTAELDNKMYYWRVRAKKNDLEWGNWMPTQSFVVSAFVS